MQKSLFVRFIFSVVLISDIVLFVTGFTKGDANPLLFACCTGFGALILAVFLAAGFVPLSRSTWSESNPIITR